MPGPWDIIDSPSTALTGAPPPDLSPDVIAQLSILGNTNKQAFESGTIDQAEYDARQSAIADSYMKGALPPDNEMGLMDALGYVLSIPSAAVTSAARLGLGAITGGAAGINPIEALQATFDPSKQATPSRLVAESDLNLPGWAKFTIGLAGDILTDPFTYIGGFSIVDDLIDVGKVTKHLGKGEFTRYVDDVVKAGKLPASVTEKQAAEAVKYGRGVLTNKQLADLGIGRRFKVVGTKAGFNLPQAKLTGELASTLTQAGRKPVANFITKYAAASDGTGVLGALFTPSRTRMAQGLLRALDAHPDSAWQFVHNALAENVSESLIGKMARTTQAEMDHFIATAPPTIAARFKEIPDPIRQVIAGATSTKGGDQKMFEWLTRQVSPILESTGILDDAIENTPLRAAQLEAALTEPILVKVPDQFAEKLGSTIDLTPYAYALGGFSEVARVQTGQSIAPFLRGAKVEMRFGGNRHITPESLWNSREYAIRVATGKEMGARMGMAEGLIANLIELNAAGRYYDDVQRLSESGKFAIEGVKGQEWTKAIDVESGQGWLLDDLEVWAKRANAKKGKPLTSEAKKMFDTAVERGAVLLDNGKYKVSPELYAVRDMAYGEAVLSETMNYVADNLPILVHLRNGGATESELWRVADNMGISPDTIERIFKVDYTGTKELKATIDHLGARIDEATVELLSEINPAILATDTAIESVSLEVKLGKISADEGVRRLIASGEKRVLDGDVTASNLRERIAGRANFAERNEIPTNEYGQLGADVPKNANKDLRKYQRGIITGLTGVKERIKPKHLFTKVQDLAAELTSGVDLTEHSYSRWVMAGELQGAMIANHEQKLLELTDIVSTMPKTPRGKGLTGGRKPGVRALAGSGDPAEREFGKQFIELFMAPNSIPAGVVDRVTSLEFAQQLGRAEPFHRAHVQAALEATRSKVGRIATKNQKYMQILSQFDLKGAAEVRATLRSSLAQAEVTAENIAKAISGDFLTSVTDATAQVVAMAARNDLLMEAEHVNAMLTGGKLNTLDEMQAIIDELGGWAVSDQNFLAKVAGARVRQLDGLTRKALTDIDRSINDPQLRPIIMSLLNKPYNSDKALKMIDGFLVETGSVADNVLYNVFKAKTPAKLNVLDKLLKPITDMWRNVAIATPGFSFRNFWGGAINNVSYMDSPVASYRAASANVDVAVHANLIERMTDSQWATFSKLQGVKKSQQEFVAGLWHGIKDQSTRDVMQRILRETDWTETGRIGELTNELLDSTFMSGFNRKVVHAGRTFDPAVALTAVGGMRRLLGEGGKLTPAGFTEAEKIAKAATGGGLKAFRATNPTVELLNRSALAIDVYSSAIKHGRTAEEAWTRAVQMVDMVHFDYSDLTSAQKRLRAAWVPFIAWRANNTPLQIDRLLRGGWGSRFSLRESNNNERRSDAFQTPWDRENYIFTDKLTFDPRIDPFNDIIDVGNSLPFIGKNKPWAFITDEMSPIAKLLYELPAGQRAGTGTGLPGGSDGLIAPPWQNVPVLGPTMGYIFQAIGQGTVNEDGVLLISSRANYAMNQMLPFLRWSKLVTNDSDPETAETDESLVVNWMNYFGIDVRYLSDPKRAKNIAHQNFQLSERMRTYLTQQGLMSYEK